MSRPTELTVVLPTIDESEGLKLLLPQLKALFERLGVSGAILVVDGGSKDDTVAVAERLGARVLRQKGRGFGAAVREGLEAAGSPWIATMDADGSHPPETIERMWSRRHEAELIVASRYCRGGSAVMPLSRQVLSRSLNAVTSLLMGLPVKDASSGFRLYKAEYALKAGSRASDFSVQQELLAGVLAAGGRAAEQPFRYVPRVGGASKASALKLAPSYLRLIFGLNK